MLDATRPDLIVGIVGTGTMGRGIAQIMAAAGATVRLLDSREGAAADARDTLAAIFAMLAEKGRMKAEAAAAAAARLVPAISDEEFAGCHVVVEAIVEDLAAKRALFSWLEPIVGDTCILATNTSSLSVTAIAAGCRRPERVAGFHFFNPVPLMRVVEVVPGALTAPWVVDALAVLAERAGHAPVRAADTPGFVVNHAGRGFGTEALRVLQEGVGSPAEVDGILRDAAEFRMGPFELLDLIGLDVSQPVMESIYRQFYDEPRFRPSYLLRQRLEAGLLGRKTGRGFYAYEDGKPVPAPRTPAAAPAARPVWIGACHEPAAAGALADLVRAAGWPVDEGQTPADASLIVTAPLGHDATTTALANGLAPSRLVAVDTLFGLARRRTVMVNPATLPEFRDAAAALFAADGTPVTLIDDSPGFVAQRVVATIVNIACDIAQNRIASPADIDTAVRLGLGYPHGPLAWGDRLGPARVLAVLEALQTATGDPRYRPSLWLSRRARLGLSLLAGEAARR
ncbi:3-hydroxyacyl-CoA dehydrogenase [Chelatococcus sp. SYSU_G07232]|uniref:3-hydroxyacyl-CoA dehydrogenase n=1 Tax=Chelatococcus albus TaxID=3047466 RepID=A0ABT7ALC2_9HYPH|nr:3-hydroxyacyl-CoA dehydrogenase [Chelatococcus sp. SYSU_G07232]MDJ1160182.1 3-hydroxyacyl-CoA dehydrogenase [Chelatococcus sp. SYSU_G07232]